MKNIAIIPARSGSKGLKGKNIKELNGKPLLAYSIDAAKNSKLFNEIMVSTDSEKYAKIAIQYGAKVPFLRSPERSGDNADSWSAVKEVLEQYVKQGKKFDTVCLLQPTSPLRTSEDIIQAYKLLIEKNANAITSVCEVEHSPLWTMTLPEDNSLEEFRSTCDSNMPRQKLRKYYRINGAIYLRKIKYIGNKVTISSEREYAMIMERSNSVDIDTKEDFEYAEFCVNRMNI